MNSLQSIKFYLPHIHSVWVWPDDEKLNRLRRSGRQHRFAFVPVIGHSSENLIDRNMVDYISSEYNKRWFCISLRSNCQKCKPRDNDSTPTRIKAKRMEWEVVRCFSFHFLSTCEYLIAFLFIIVGMPWQKSILSYANAWHRIWQTWCMQLKPRKIFCCDALCVFVSHWPETAVANCSTTPTSVVFASATIHIHRHASDIKCTCTYGYRFCPLHGTHILARASSFRTANILSSNNTSDGTK